MFNENRPNGLFKASSLLVVGLVSLQIVVAFAADAAKSGPSAGPAAAILHGRVKDDLGKPLADVRVRIAIPAADMREVNTSSGHRLEETKTDAKGEYRLVVTGITKATNVSLDAMKPGFRRLVGTFMSGGDDKSVAIVPGKSAEASLTLKDPALYASGLVVDEHGKSIPGVQIETSLGWTQGVAYIERTASNSAGTFELFSFPVEAESLDVDAIKKGPGKGTTSKGVISFSHPDYIASEIADVYALSEKQRGTLRVVLTPGRKLAGTLLDVAGKPVSNGIVRAVHNDGTHRKATLTDADGTFALHGLAEGPTTLWAHREGLKQTSRSQIDIRGNQAGVTLRLQPIPLARDVKTYSVLGMQLVDLTPELKVAYDVSADCGALILDPGKDFGNRSLRPLREGFCFVSVGDESIRSVRHFVNEIISAAAPQRSDFYTISVNYEFNSVYLDGNMGQHFVLSKDELKSLKGVLAEFAKSEQEAIVALHKLGALIQSKSGGPAYRFNAIPYEPVVNALVLGKKWKGGDADLRKVPLISTLEALHVAGTGKVSDKALDGLRKAAPGIYVERVSEAWLGLGGDSLKHPKGFKITTVVPNSPAARAGFQPGDVLQEFAGKAIPDFPSLRASLLSLKSGQKVVARVVRDKKAMTLPVELGEWD